MGNIENEKFFSWEICNNSYVTKKVDKSFYKYGETVIPIEVRDYFNIQHYKKGDDIEIIMIFKGKEYNANIVFEKNFNRSKLKVNKLLKEEVKRYIDISCCKGDFEKNIVKAVFVKQVDNRYVMNLRIDI